MHHSSDAELVRRAQAGQVRAIGELYDRHHARIYKYVRSRIYDTQLAQDLTGEVFLRMVQHIKGYQETGAPFTAWLYRIARNHLINHIQQQNAHPLETLEVSDRVIPDGDDPAALVENRLATDHLLAAMHSLEDIQREVLALRFLAGLSLKETADTLQKSVAAVKSIQHRGLRQMRALIGSRP